MLNHGVDTSYLMSAPGSACAITFPSPTKTEAEKIAEKAEWDDIFNNNSNPASKVKPKKQKGNCKNKFKGWTDKKRVSWAKAHYQLHHGQDKQSTTIFFANLDSTMCDEDNLPAEGQTTKGQAQATHGPGGGSQAQ